MLQCDSARTSLAITAGKCWSRKAVQMLAPNHSLPASAGKAMEAGQVLEGNNASDDDGGGGG